MKVASKHGRVLHSVHYKTNGNDPVGDSAVYGDNGDGADNTSEDGDGRDKNAETNDGEQKGKSWRSDPNVKGLFKKMGILEKELKRYRDAEKTREDEIEAEKLKASESSESVFKIMKDREQALTEKFMKETRRLTLEAALAGIEDKHTRKGVISECPDDMDIEEYVSSVKEEFPHYWGKSNPSVSKNTTTPTTGRAGGGGSTDWAKVKSDMDSSDWKVAGPAYDKVSAYYAKHGKYPDGIKF